MDAVFDSSGNVSGNSGGNRLTAWSGQGLANLLAPTTSGITSAGSLLPDSSALGQAVRRSNRYSYSYPEAKNVDYAKIAQEAADRAAATKARSVADPWNGGYGATRQQINAYNSTMSLADRLGLNNEQAQTIYDNIMAGRNVLSGADRDLRQKLTNDVERMRAQMGWL